MTAAAARKDTPAAEHCLSDVKLGYIDGTGLMTNRRSLGEPVGGMC
jgi:hypothetical protein